MRKFSHQLSAISYQFLLTAGFIYLVLFFLFILPRPAEALYREVKGSNNYQDYSFAIFANNDEPNPPEFVKDTGDILIGITAWKGGQQADIFKTGTLYYILFENPDVTPFYRVTRDADLSLNPATVKTRAKSSNELTFTVPAKGIGSQIGISGNITPGTYKIKVWSSEERSPQKPLFEGVDFPINSPAGGTSANLSAIGEANICLNKTTEVKIDNAEKGKTFNLYWKGDLRDYAWSGPASDRTFTTPIKGRESAAMTPGSTETLCMIEGDVRLYPSLQLFGCTSPLTFTVKASDDPFCLAKNKPSCSAEVKLVENDTAKKRIVITGQGFPASTQVRGDLLNKSTGVNEPTKSPIQVSANGTITYTTGEIPPGKYAFYFYPQDGDTLLCPIDNIDEVTNKVESGNAPNPDQINFKSIVCDPKSTDAENRCANSSGEYCDAEKKILKTAIGCIPTDPSLFVAGGLKYLTGFSGGAALLMMIYGAFQMMLSQGNAEALKKGREQFVSAIIGLLFVIFSVLLLQIIGVDILGLPGFKK